MRRESRIFSLSRASQVILLLGILVVFWSGFVHAAENWSPIGPMGEESGHSQSTH